MRGGGANFEKGRAGVEQALNAVTREQLATRDMPVAGALTSAKGRSLRRFADFSEGGQVRLTVRGIGRIAGGEGGGEFHLISSTFTPNSTSRPGPVSRKRCGIF